MTPIDEFLRKIKPGEPIFCLRAQDEIAPIVLEHWAVMLEIRAHDRDKGGAPLPRVVDARLNKAKEARALAHEMRAWQARNGSKVPD